MTTDKNPSAVTYRVLVPVLLAVIVIMGAASITGLYAQSSLSIHEAKQNGSFKIIDHKLGDLKKQIEKVDENQTTRIDKLETTIIQLLTESGPTN